MTESLSATEPFVAIGASGEMRTCNKCGGIIDPPEDYKGELCNCGEMIQWLQRGSVFDPPPRRGE